MTNRLKTTIWLSAIAAVVALCLAQLAIAATIAYQQGDGKGTPSDTDDSHINASYPTTNYSTATIVEIDTSGTSSDHIHAIVKFPNIFGSGTDQIPSGSTITSATLQLYVTNVTNVNPTVYQLTESWTESQVTWNSRSTGVSWTNTGGDGTTSHKSAAEGAFPMTSTGAQTMAVTTSVQNWSNGEANQGWIFIDNSTNGCDFYSSEYATAASRPKLTVVYTAPPANSAPNAPTIDNYNTGAWGNDNTPTLQFDLTDPDSGDIVKYQIQIDTAATFDSQAGSPLADFTETAGSPGYAVPRNDVTYTPSALSNGVSYYWRVRGIDDDAATGSWATANGGAIAFKVDTAAPTNVGCSSPSNGATGVATSPTLTALTAADSGSGLNASAYYLELATDTVFTQNTQNSGWDADGSWAPSTPLSTNTVYYWRVRARDAVANTSSLCGHTPDVGGYGTFTTAASTIVSSTIDYDDGAAINGTSWGQISWVDTETTGSIIYQVEYYTGAAWALIPDGALSGNSSGFGTSPIDISGLNTTTYNQIRLKATFTWTTGTPILSDWTVTWNAGVEVDQADWTPADATLNPGAATNISYRVEYQGTETLVPNGNIDYVQAIRSGTVEGTTQDNAASTIAITTESTIGAHSYHPKVVMVSTTEYDLTGITSGITVDRVKITGITFSGGTPSGGIQIPVTTGRYWFKSNTGANINIAATLDYGASAITGGKAYVGHSTNASAFGDSGFFSAGTAVKNRLENCPGTTVTYDGITVGSVTEGGNNSYGTAVNVNGQNTKNIGWDGIAPTAGTLFWKQLRDANPGWNGSTPYPKLSVSSYVYIDGYTLYYQRAGSTDVNLVVEGASDNLGSVEYDFPDILGSNPSQGSSAISAAYNISSVDSGSTNVACIVVDPVTNAVNTNNISIEEILSQPAPTAILCKTASDGSAISSQTWQADNDPYAYWTPPASPSGIASYDYKVNNADTEVEQIAATSTGANAYVQLGADVLPDGKWRIRTRALNNVSMYSNWSGSSDWFDIWVDATPPVAGSLSYGTIAASSIAVSVSGASDATSGLPANYCYFEYDAGATTFAVADANSGWCAASWTPTGLTENTAYAFRYKLKDNAGNETSWQTPSPAYKYTLPPAPTISSCTAQTDQPLNSELGKIIINWSSSPAATAYTLERDTSSAFSSPATVVNNQSVTTATDTGLNDNATYYYRAKGRNPDNAWSDYSSPASSAVTPDRTKPQTPSLGTAETNCVGYWSFDDTNVQGRDSSAYGNDGTVTGATSVTGVSSNALNFNGSSNYVSAGSMGQISSGSDWTVSFWMKSNAVENYRNPFDANFVAGGNNAGPRFEQYNGGTFKLIVGTDVSNYIAPVYTTGMTTGIWYHVVAVRSGNTIIGYLNGVQAFNQGNALWPSSFSAINIGRGFSTSAERWYNGLVDEVRVYNRALTASEIQAHYSSGLNYVQLSAKPGDASLVGYWPLDEGSGSYAYDVSGNGKIGTLTQMDPATDWVAGKFGKALDFDGTNDTVNIGTLSYSNNITVSAWIYKSDANTGWNDIIAGGCGDVLFGIANNYLNWGGQCNSPFGMSVSTMQLNDSTWHHVVGTYNGSVAKLYVDGVLNDQDNRSGSFTPGNIAIGSTGGSEYFTGKIDDVRIYNAALTDQQVYNLYSSGANNYTYYRSTASSGTYVPVGDAAIYDTFDRANNTTVGSASPGTAWIESRNGSAVGTEVDTNDNKILNNTLYFYYDAGVQQPISQQNNLKISGTLGFETATSEEVIVSVRAPSSGTYAPWNGYGVVFKAQGYGNVVGLIDTSNTPFQSVSYTFATSTEYQFEIIIASDNAITVSINGVQVLKGSARTPTAAGTHFNLGAYGSVNNKYFKDIAVIPLNATSDTFGGYYQDFAGIANGDITTVSGWTKDVADGSAYTVDAGRLKMAHPASAPSGAYDYAMYELPSEITSNAVIEFDITVADSNSYDFMFMAGDSGATSHESTQMVHSAINNEDWQTWNSGSGWQSIKSGLTVGTTYHFKIYIDNANDNARYYVDGVYGKTLSFPDAASTGVKKIYFGDYGYSSVDTTWYVNNISVTPVAADKGDSQSPTTPAFYASDATDGSASHNASAWQSGISNDNTVDFGWQEPVSNGDDYFYYMKAVDSQGNESNLMSNPGVENASGGNATGWGEVISPQVDGIDAETGNIYSGNRTQKVTANLTGQGGYGYRYSLSGLSAGDYYKFEFWYKAPSSNTLTMIAIIVVDQTPSGQAVPINISLTADDAWHKAEAVGQMPSNASGTGYIDLPRFQTATGTATLYFDNVGLYKVTKHTVTTPIAGYYWAANDTAPETGGTWVARTTLSTASPALSDGIGNYIYVKAEDGAGNLSGARTFGPFYIDATAPVPGTLQYSNITHNSMTVTISGASDATSGIVTNGYYIEYDANAVSFSVTDASTWCNGTWDISGINPNKPYAFRWKVKDNAGNETSMQTASPAYRYTLPSPTNIPTDPACDRSASTWYQGVKTTEQFTFSSANLTAGNVQYYRYVWDRSPSTTVTSGGTQWPSGSLPLYPPNSKSIYLHIVPYNAADEANTQADFGPFYFVDTSRLLKHKKFFDDDGVLQSIN